MITFRTFLSVFIFFTVMDLFCSILTTTRSWSNAPSDLMSSIANGLGLIDLLSFRSVCKDWHLASPTSSAEIKSHPWLLLCNEGSTNCILYNVTVKNKYNINLPELQGTICLASNQGWLLLSRGSSIFFFCPFSRSKIDLPEYPHTKLVDHVAAFSSPPTCQDCVVSIINRCDEKRLELNVIHRGENTWTTHTCNRRDGEGSIGAITCGTYCEQVFYFVDKEVMSLITFSPKNDKVKPYKIVKNNNPNIERMPFVSRRRHFLDTDMKFLLKLEGNVAVSTCGTMIRAEKRDIFIHNEDTKAVSEGSKTCHMRGIWIHPRFLQVPASQGWSI